MSMLSASTPDVSRHFLDRMKKTFPQIEIIPNVTTQDEIMYNAGMQALIKWIEHQATKEMIITGGN